MLVATEVDWPTRFVNSAFCMVKFEKGLFQEAKQAKIPVYEILLLTKTHEKLDVNTSRPSSRSLRSLIQNLFTVW